MINDGSWKQEVENLVLIYEFKKQSLFIWAFRQVQ